MLDSSGGSPAVLVGLVNADVVSFEPDACNVQAHMENADPFQVRILLPDSMWIQFEFAVTLTDAARSISGRLPGLRVNLPRGHLQCAFKWDSDGWGGFWANLHGLEPKTSV